MTISALHQELIRRHYRASPFRGTLPPPARFGAAENPVCGDHIVLQLHLSGGLVEQVRFGGHGCAVSQAAASMLCQLVQGKNTSDAEALATRLRQMIHGDEAAARDEMLGDLRALAGIARLPGRVRCALLAWDAFAAALNAG